MKKWISLLLVVVLLFTCFVGCKDSDEGNEEKKNAGLEAAVAMVNDVAIKRGAVEEMLYEQLGYYISLLDATQLATYRAQILDVLIQQEIARQKAVELGYDELTEEDLAQIDKSYKDFYDNGIAYFTEELKNEDAENGVFEEEIAQTDYTKRAEEKLIAYLEEGYYYSVEMFPGKTVLEKYKNYIKDSYIISNKLLLGVTTDVTVSDDVVKSTYDSLLTDQKKTYDADITKYEEAISANLESQYYTGKDSVHIVYVPEGYRYVKHILVMFPEATKKSISDVEYKMSEAEYYYNSAKTALESAEKAVTDAADDEKKAEAQTKLDAAQKEYDTKKKTYDDAKKAYDDAIKAAAEEADMKKKVDDIYAKVKAGEDFDELIKTYGEDPGMKDELYKNGYLLSAKTTTYYQIFTDTGMALENVGDCSEPVYSTHGAHVIKYVSAVTPGEIAFEDVKDNIKESLLTEERNKEFLEILTDWESNGGFRITQYTDALNSDLPTTTTQPTAETK